MRQSLPNWLTLSRIVLIPLLIGFFYIPGPLGSWLVSIVFLLACVTDYLDGYLARAWAVQSTMGRVFDPIADKLLVATALLLLVSRGDAHTLPSLAILCREILVSGLREHLAHINVSMPVTRLAKYKTGIQMTALNLLLAVAALTQLFDGTLLGDARIWMWFGNILLWIAAALTLITGYAYLKTGLKHVNE